MIEGVISVVFVGRICLGIAGWMVVRRWARRWARSWAKSWAKSWARSWAKSWARQSLRPRLTSRGWLDLRQVTGDRETQLRPEWG